MTLEKMTARLADDSPALDLEHIRNRDRFRDAVIRVIGLSGGSTGKVTHYNSAAEESAARRIQRGNKRK